MDSVGDIRIKFDKIKKKISGKKKEIIAGMENRMQMAMVVYLNSVDKVIRAYNIGAIERYPGDFAKRQLRNSKMKNVGNNPLIDQGFLSQKISFTVLKKRSGARGVLVFNARGGANNRPYPRDLNDGTKYIKPYRFKQIALQMSEKKIREVLGGKYD